MKILIRKSALSLTLIRIEDEDEYQRYQEVGGVQLTIHSLVVQIIEVNWLNKIKYSRLEISKNIFISIVTSSSTIVQ